MRPTLEDLRTLCPDLPADLAKEHLARLPEHYFGHFSLQFQCDHIQGLSSLTPARPVAVTARAARDGGIECTVLAFDYPGAFSLIAGILSSLGASIRAGDVFTYRPAPPPPRTRRPAPRPRRGSQQLRRRRIVDCFLLELTEETAPEHWLEELQQRLQDVFVVLEKGGPEAMARAQYQVNQLVARRLEELAFAGPPVLYPMTIDVSNESLPHTRLRVTSEDTPVFLYALSHAFALRAIAIEHVKIRTFGNRIEDELDIADARGQQITDPQHLNQIKLSVLLTKQFTYFLPDAPQPYDALCRFGQLVGDVLSLPEQGKWVEMLSTPAILQDLAKLLGASDFMWEDFVRLQYESLLPMLRPHVDTGEPFHNPENLPQRLVDTMAGAASLEERRQRLNDFKDREIFLIDLDHLLTRGVDFRVMAARLSQLAELVADTAAAVVYEAQRERYGTPRTVAGLEAVYAVFGLGKLGGAALGYASDVELLFVYNDNGRTDGPSAIDNAEFFNRLVDETRRFITHKRDGIFDIDLRLRPHGNDGPLGVSLASFCQYYGPGGPAHSYERLALVRLRAIGGDSDLGERVERLRDEFVYFTKSIHLAELQELRLKQFKEKSQMERLNAKFSPGALVDLEYDVQMLQVMHGRQSAELRTPRLHGALEGLAKAGVISEQESRGLSSAYDFLRRLINGLRMLRGDAKDLFLPQPDSDEFAHLARRMGYERADALSPAQQLRLDFDTCTATVRAFVERHFGRDSLPGPAIGNVADLVLSSKVPEDLRRDILRKAGFQDPDRAYTNLRHLSGDAQQQRTFVRLAVLACDILRKQPDADMALNNWERFVAALDTPEQHYEALLGQPMHLEILLAIFSRSQFLADTLVRNPEFLDWATVPAHVAGMRGMDALLEDLSTAAAASADYRDWLNRLRRFRRRELLRIGTRDMCLDAPIEEITGELSHLAESMIRTALREVWSQLRTEGRIPAELHSAPEEFCVLAFGKLGGGELNYSSDVDLLGLFRGADGEETEVRDRLFARVMERLRAALSAHTEEGHAYRVDLRLRPYGRAGQLVLSSAHLLDYYRDAASLWEVQALLKTRPIAGNLLLGQQFLGAVREHIVKPREAAAVIASIEKMRRACLDSQRADAGTDSADVKSGIGGIRDVEFLVQGLQLIHAHRHPDLLDGNTLRALKRLQLAGVLPRETAAQLSTDYRFLRRTEHFLQIFEDRQIHSLPKSDAELTALARRLLGSDADAAKLQQQLGACQTRVHAAYDEFLLLR